MCAIPHPTVFVDVSVDMGNILDKQDGTVTIQSSAVNVEKSLAERGLHLEKFCTLDQVIHCSIRTRGLISNRSSGAFLWYLCSPTPKQLGILSQQEDWTNRYYKHVGSGLQSVSTLTEGTDVLISRNDLDLSVGDENIFSNMSSTDKSRVEMTMNSRFDLTKTGRGLVPGKYRVDFYRSSSPFTNQFYSSDVLPLPSKSLFFDVI